MMRRCLLSQRKQRSLSNDFSRIAVAVVLILLSPSIALAETSVIVDDEDGEPGFTTTGDDWTTWSTLSYGFDARDTSFHYLSHTVGGSDRQGTATWTPELPCAGTYEIATWFRRTENRTRDADHIVYDGLGGATSISIDQYGDGASGWVSLGEYYCESGFGGCSVVLDGTDDDSSDEANAMQFTLIACDGDPDDSVEECAEVPEPGVHEVTLFAGRAWSSGGWDDVSLATGAADGLLAETENLDEGELLYGSGWDLCNPAGDETILSVEVGCRGETQYDSGTYDVLVELSAGGSSATQWHHTELSWDTVDVTGDSDDWSWFALNQLVAQVGLHSHPGGASDSNVLVDAFRLRVVYETPEPDAEEDAGPVEPDAGPSDAGSDASEPDSDLPADGGVSDDSGAPDGGGDAIDAEGDDGGASPASSGLSGACSVVAGGLESHTSGADSLTRLLVRLLFHRL